MYRLKSPPYINDVELPPISEFALVPLTITILPAALIHPLVSVRTFAISKLSSNVTPPLLLITRLLNWLPLLVIKVVAEPEMVTVNPDWSNTSLDKSISPPIDTPVDAMSITWTLSIQKSL